MIQHRLLKIAVISALLPSQVFAQQSQQASLGGNPVAGVCLLSREAIFANAKVAQAANARLKQISDQAQAEVDAERRPLDGELKALQAEAGKLSAEERRSKEEALAAKLRPVQAKAEHRSREIEATRTKVLARISAEAQPVIEQVYKQKNCGLLFDRNTVLGGNMANDLTQAVIQGIDAKITTISFDRETLTAQAAGNATAQ